MWAGAAGHLEDLWAFNEEVLARAIYDSKIPIISAVGHEIDTTIADLVADARASTPTKAGVVAVPDVREVLEKLSSAQSRLTGDIESVIELAEQDCRRYAPAPRFAIRFCRCGTVSSSWMRWEAILKN